MASKTNIPLEAFQSLGAILQVAEWSESQIGFKAVRFFSITALLDKQRRGGHAHKECFQFLISTNGKIQVETRSGPSLSVVASALTPGNFGLLVPPLTWVDLSFPQRGDSLVVLASHPFDEDDYIRDFAAFRSQVK